VKKYALNLLVALDQLCNAVLLGDPDETLSSRAGKGHPRMAKLINWLFRNPNHCANVIEADEGGNAVPVRDYWQVIVFADRLRIHFMGTLISFLGSGAFGSLLGSAFAWLNRREERAAQKDKFAHDEAMAKLENDQQIAMANKAIEQTTETGKQVVAAKEADAFTESQKAANTAAVSSSPTLSAIRDVLNGIVRPVVTLYTLVLATVLSFQIARLVGGLGSLDHAALVTMYAGVIDQIFFLTNLTVSWWFGARGNSTRITLPKVA
jgi:hypothetical protein